jgi:two-component system response regulator AtoC
MGAVKPVTVDVRVCAATHKDLRAEVVAGRFREDLYFRIGRPELRVPPLRERREEIPALIDHFRRRFSTQYGRSVDVPAETVRVFVEYHWPGNIRELENAVKRIIVLGSARTVHQEIVGNLNRGLRPSTPASAPFAPAAAPASDAPVSLKDIARQAAREAERVAIKEVLDRVHWNRAKAARLLQISYKALLYKIVQCGLATQDTEKEKEVVAS